MFHNLNIRNEECGKNWTVFTSMKEHFQSKQQIAQMQYNNPPSPYKQPCSLRRALSIVN